MALTLLPPAEPALIAWMRADSDLSALCGGRVGTKLNATLPAFRVTRVGGVAEEAWLDRPSVQVEAWAADAGTADTLIRSFVAALPRLARYAYQGTVWSAAVTSGPIWFPDDPNLSSNARYLVTVELLTTTP